MQDAIYFAAGIVFFYFNSFRCQGLHLFLDTPLLCPYNPSKDRMPHK